MSLALEFGRCDVEAFRDELTYKDFIRWFMFYKKEPFGLKREDMRSAMIATVMANCWSKKRHTLKDFMLSFEPPKPMDWKVMKNMLKGLCKD